MPDLGKVGLDGHTSDVNRLFVRSAGLTAALALGLVLITGCGRELKNPPGNPPAAPAATSSVVAARATPASDEGPVYHLDHAQPKLATLRLRLGAHELDAEVCTTITQIATGLMFRPGIGPEEGMLFVFSGPHQPAFYMKNVSFDIDVAYIDTEGVITEVVRLKAQDRTPVPAKSDRVQYVLEAAPDYFTKHGLGVGTLILSDRGTLKQTFVRR